jgi:hypothetical protein
MPRPQRTRVPSQKVQENQLNNQLEAQSVSREAFREASSAPKPRSRKQTKTQASQSASEEASTAEKPIKSRKKKKQTKASKSITGAPLKPIPKIPSILGQSKSARQLRQNLRTALLPFLMRENASREEEFELPFAEEGPNDDDDLMPSLFTLFEKQENPSAFNSYIDGVFPKSSSNSESISQKEVEAVNYYSHLKFTPMKRNLHKAQYNLSEDLTDPFEIFQLFFPKKYMEFFAKYTNEYAEQKMKRREKEALSRPSYIRGTLKNLFHRSRY